MPLVPEFMVEFERFVSERRAVRTLADWKTFQARWFDTSSWPRKTGEQIALESRDKVGPFRLAGRLWGYTSWTYDLTPEARYEYFSTLVKVKQPLIFPECPTAPAPGSSGWSQECPHCEISTSEIGDAECPRCRRELLYVCSTD